MRIICPKIFAKLYFFATMSHMGVANSALNCTFVPQCLPCLPSS